MHLPHIHDVFICYDLDIKDNILVIRHGGYIRAFQDKCFTQTNPLGKMIVSNVSDVWLTGLGHLAEGPCKQLSDRWHCSQIVSAVSTTRETLLISIFTGKSICIKHTARNPTTCVL